MSPTMVLLGIAEDDVGVADDEFELDMRIVESVTPLVEMMCDTNDGCGSTCSTSACNSRASDPL
jgi:FxLD family lantipeptide